MKENIRISKEVLDKISAEQAWHYGVVPCALDGQTLKVYIAEGGDELGLLELGLIVDCRIEAIRIPEEEMKHLLGSNYKRSYTEGHRKNLEVGTNEDFLELMIKEARNLGSSDIHIERYEKEARVRFRIDGVLVERYGVREEDYPVLVNKLKISAHLDIAEKRLPQDGRISYVRYGEEIDIRMSVLPTLHGEKVVLRLLNRDASGIRLDDLGMDPGQVEVYRDAIHRPTGIVLISGPTGSGKTTTLYASLKELNRPERNILTIEDPIEYTLEGVNQVQLKESIGLGFSEALRSFLRQDPDIIMLGEIRDVKTAEMAVRASLTGHLVFSTVHTNSAWGTVSRLCDMGVPPYLLASTLRLTVAQRLIRKLCAHCKERVAVPEDFKAIVRNRENIFEARACPKCYHTGYSGRVAIYEMIPIHAKYRQKLRNEEPMEREELEKDGILSLRNSALSLLENGLTSLDEVYPIIHDQ